MYLFLLQNHGTPLEDLAGSRSAGCLKVFIQRDYSEGTSVKFQTKFPPELEGKVRYYRELLFWLLQGGIALIAGVECNGFFYDLGGNAVERCCFTVFCYILI